MALVCQVLAEERYPIEEKSKFSGSVSFRSFEARKRFSGNSLSDNVEPTTRSVAQFAVSKLTTTEYSLEWNKPALIVLRLCGLVAVVRAFVISSFQSSCFASAEMIKFFVVVVVPFE